MLEWSLLNTSSGVTKLGNCFQSWLGRYMPSMPRVWYLFKEFLINWIGQLYCFVLMTFKNTSPLFKTLLEGCCSDEILYINANGQFMLDTDSSAVIQDVQLLEKLLLDWKIWSKAKVITFILERFLSLKVYIWKINEVLWDLKFISPVRCQ